MAKRKVYRMGAGSIMDLVLRLLPYDSNGFLAEFVKRRLEDRTIILNEAVYEELLDKHDGIAVAKLGFLRTVPHEDRLDPSGKLAERVRKEWTNMRMKPRTLAHQYQKFIGSGDFNVVALSKEANSLEQTTENIVVIEEVFAAELDGVQHSHRPFKKTSELCRQEKVAHRDIVTMLQELGVRCDFSLKKSGGK